MRMTLAIIAALVLLAVMPPCIPFNRVRRDHFNAKSLVEIEQLAQTIVEYKQDRTVYPPCIADTDPQVRKVRFVMHLAMAYPNCEYGADAAAYDVLNAKVQTEWKYNFLHRDGTLAPLDLDRLDAAESLVFWLGGFATPYSEVSKQPIAGRSKLFGFHADDDTPFKRDPSHIEQPQPLKHRTDLRFPFDERGLVDRDEDGWFEYALGTIRDRYDDASPPLVYFDAETYTAASLERAHWGSCFYPHDPVLAAKWGTAAPYLAKKNPRPIESIVWAKAEHFQIISAGLDGKYGPVGDGKTLPPRRLTVFGKPETYSADDDFQQPHELDDAESDNLTNLSSKPIGVGVQNN